MTRSKSVGSALALLLIVIAGLAASPSQARVPAVPDVPDQTASFNGTVRVVAYHAGVVFVGGDFTAAVQNGVSVPRHHLAAVDSATGVLLPWNPKADGRVNALVVTRHWTYVGGAFKHIGGRAHARVARVHTASGKVDRRFRGSARGQVMALAVLHRSLYAGGTITRADRRKVHHLAAFDTRTGALHRHWKPRTNGAVYTVRVAHGAVYAGGDFTKLNGNARGRYLAAVNPTSGALRRHYTSSVVYPIFDVAVKGKVVYAAADGPGGRLEALNLNGSGRWTVTTDGAVQAVAVLGGTVYAGGHFDHVCQTGATGVNGTCAVSMANRFKFMAVSTGGTLRPWAPQGNGLLGAVTLAADSHAQRLAAGGDFTKFHSTTTQPFFAQFG